MKRTAESHIKVFRGNGDSGRVLEIETSARQFPPSLFLTVFGVLGWFMITAVFAELVWECVYMITGAWGWCVLFLFGIPMEYLCTSIVIVHFFGRRVVRIVGNYGTSFVGIWRIGWYRRFVLTPKSRLRIGRLHDMGYTFDRRDNPPGILLRNGRKRLCIYRDIDMCLVQEVAGILLSEFLVLKTRNMSLRS